MCMGGGSSKTPDYAAQQRALEAEKQAKIAAEVKRINEAFGGFNDDYFGGVAQAYINHYTPELSKQYDNARKMLIEANPGGGAGSAYNQALADLDEEYARQQAQMRDNATKFAAEHRGNIEGQRSSLFNMATMNAGSGAAAAQALNQARALATPPPYSALGDLFARITGNLAAIKQQNAGYMPLQPAPNLNFAIDGKGSTTIVR